jgi:hypothetical protein
MTVCVRCERDAPSPVALASGSLALADDAGEKYALVCPDCFTRDERRDLIDFLRRHGENGDA